MTDTISNLGDIVGAARVLDSSAAAQRQTSFWNPDPMQARVMQIMPVMFTVFFAFFPSGLVLYWVTNTLLSIAQQWYINKLVHAEALARKGGKKKKDKDKDKS